MKGFTVRLVQSGGTAIWRDGIYGNTASVFNDGVPGLLRLVWNRFTAVSHHGPVPDSTQFSVHFISSEAEKLTAWIASAFMPDGGLRFPLPLGMRI